MTKIYNRKYCSGFSNIDRSCLYNYVVYCLVYLWCVIVMHVMSRSEMINFWECKVHLAVPCAILLPVSLQIVKLIPNLTFTHAIKMASSNTPNLDRVPARKITGLLAACIKEKFSHLWMGYKYFACQSI